MDGYEITTAHNVTLRFGYASLGDRILASILDWLIKIGYIAALSFIIAMAAKWKLVPSGSTALWTLFIGLCSLPVIFYSLLFEYFTNGQTPGKRALKIKVASQNTEHLTFGKCLIRWLFRIVDFGICYGAIALVAVAVTAKKQRIGDLVAATVVVSLKAEKTLDQTIYAYVGPDREVRYRQADRLSAREVEIIKEVIRQYEQEGKYDLIPMTAARVRTAIGAGEEQDDLSFLRAVAEDYYTLAAR